MGVAFQREDEVRQLVSPRCACVHAIYRPTVARDQHQAKLARQSRARLPHRSTGHSFVKFMKGDDLHYSAYQ